MFAGMFFFLNNVENNNSDAASMLCNGLRAWWLGLSRLAALLPSLVARRRVVSGLAGAPTCVFKLGWLWFGDVFGRARRGSAVGYVLLRRFGDGLVVGCSFCFVPKLTLGWCVAVLMHLVGWMSFAWTERLVCW